MKIIQLVANAYGVAVLLWRSSLAQVGRSPWKRGPFAVGLLVLLWAAAITCLEFSQYQSQRAFDLRVSELNRGLENAKLEAAIDAIDACQRISTTTPKKATRTCEIAELLYQDAFRNVTSPLVAQNLSEHEYELMRGHIGRVLKTSRAIEQYRAQEADLSPFRRYPFSIVGFLLAFAVATLLPCIWFYAASTSGPLKTTPRRLNRRLVESRSTARM